MRYFSCSFINHLLINIHTVLPYDETTFLAYLIRIPFPLNQGKFALFHILVCFFPPKENIQISYIFVLYTTQTGSCMTRGIKGETILLTQHGQLQLA